MPSESKREQIAQAVEAQLKTIHKTSGYWYDVKNENVSRVLLPLDQALSSARKPLLIVITGDGDKEPLTTYRQDQEAFEVIIVGYTKSEDKEMTRTRLERLVVDVTKALYANVTLNALCRTLYVTSVITDEGELAFRNHGQFEMTLKIEYVYSWTNP